MTKESLEAAISVANTWSERSTILLVLGIIGEYIALPFLEKYNPRLNKGWKATKSLSVSSRLHKASKILFALMVVGGIFGEYKFSKLIASDASLLQQISDETVAGAQRDASRAIDSASKITASNLSLSLKLAEQVRSNLKLQNEIAVQGPRWQLLEKRKNEFVAALKPLAGQSIIVVTCGFQLDSELGILAQSIMANIRGNPNSESLGAGWKIGFAIWMHCTPGGGYFGGGNKILVSDMANDRVKQAARVLNDEFNDLNISTSWRTVGPDLYGKTEKLMGPDSPDMQALRNPESVVLFIGNNPMVSIKKPKSTR